MRAWNFKRVHRNQAFQKVCSRENTKPYVPFFFNLNRIEYANAAYNRAKVDRDWQSTRRRSGKGDSQEVSQLEISTGGELVGSWYACLRCWDWTPTPKWGTLAAPGTGLV